MWRFWFEVLCNLWEGLNSRFWVCFSKILHFLHLVFISSTLGIFKLKKKILTSCFNQFFSFWVFCFKCCCRFFSCLEGLLFDKVLFIFLHFRFSFMFSSFSFSLHVLEFHYRFFVLVFSTNFLQLSHCNVCCWFISYKFYCKFKNVWSRVTRLNLMKIFNFTFQRTKLSFKPCWIPWCFININCLLLLTYCLIGILELSKNKVYNMVFPIFDELI